MKLLRYAGLVLVISLMAGCASQGLEKRVDKELAVLPEKELFMRAEQSLADGQYKSAVKYYEALEAQYPFGTYSQQAQLDIVYAYYRAEDLAGTEVAADHYIKLYPRDQHVDYAYYLKALANFENERNFFMKYFSVDDSLRDLTRLHASFNDFAAFVRLFPDSRYKADAIQRMIHLRNLFASRELHIATFYYQRRAYVAAINRANVIVRQYSQAPQTADALILLVKANRALGLTQEANHALALLRVNYPSRMAEVK